MLNVEFIHNNQITIVQCNQDDKMKEIINKFLTKTDLDRSSVTFLYSGILIDEKTNISEIKANNLNAIKILVVSNDETTKEKVIIKSKYIICPICKENIRFKINDYKIYLYDCKNGHKVNSILLNEFEDTQNINISEIECNSCKDKNKGNTYNNEFYKCLTCDKNICPLCKTSHTKEKHNVINYEERDYKCVNHNELFSKYCNECKSNICLFCENEHKNHKNESYSDIIPDIDKLKEKMNELKEEIDKFNSNIKDIINKLYKVMGNMEIYYKINENILNNYEKKIRNYIMLQNINEINNNILEEIKDINDNINENNKINNILNIYDKMVNKDITEINIIYDIDKRDKENEKDIIKIFGDDFVKNNKNKCKMIIENEEYELEGEYNIKDYKNNKLEIKLKGIDNITNMSCMFSGCSSLSSYHHYLIFQNGILKMLLI